MSKRQYHRKSWHAIPGFLIFTGMLFGGLAAGFGLGNLLFRYTGRPPEFWAYAICGLFGMFLLTVVIWFALRVIRKRGHMNDHRGMITETLEALDRISKGDFSVMLTVNENDPFTELNRTVNKMAQDLSSMESQRQDFISNVSHEIQSPLTSITGFAALLKTGSLTQEQKDHYLDIIETESKRLSKLSDNLLKLSNLEAEATPLAQHEFRLDKQMRDAVLMLEPQWSAKNIVIDAALADITVYADEDLLSQVWINLLHNAVKYTPENGEIRLSASREENTVACCVSDNGPGISQEDQIHIFERFYKVDKSRDRSLGGNGLGLSLCKKIVEVHGGMITMESEPGRGTTFVVRLPG